MTDLWSLSAVDLAQRIRTGAVSAREAVQSALDRLDAVNPRLNAVVLALHAQALRQADAADAMRARGEALPALHGVPVTTKVNTDQTGLPTDNGVVAFKDVIAPADSPVIARLHQAGAIVIGRTNTPALSMRAQTDNALHGLTRNPWHAGITAGGSSGGAGSAVAAGIGAIGHGNDIGGSIRYPAYCNGVAGLRPSFGRVPAWNPSAAAPRPITAQLMSVNGPLARRVADLRLALAAMAGYHPMDPRSTDAPLQGPPPRRPIRIAMLRAWPGVTNHPAVTAAIDAAAGALAAQGYEIEEIAPPCLEETQALWMKIGNADIIAALAPVARDYGDAGINAFLGHWSGADVAWTAQDTLVGLGRREQIIHLWQMFLEQYPLVLLPISPFPPMPHHRDIESAEGAAEMVAAIGPLIALAVLGLPAVAVPTGVQDGVPMGVQLVATRMREDLCLDAAEVIEARLGALTPIDPRF